MEPNTTNPSDAENTAKTASTEHRKQESNKLSALGKSLFKYVEFDDSETILVEVRKHPFGMFLIICTGIIIALILMVVLVVLALNLDTFGVVGEGGSSAFSGILVGLGLALALLTTIITGVTAILYRLNVVYVTNEKIAQVNYMSLFHREVSQLNIGKVEDVTITQRGVFAYIFNYGTFQVETAGELPNKQFTYVSKPHEISKIIIDAHELYVEKYGN